MLTCIRAYLYTFLCIIYTGVIHAANGLVYVVAIPCILKDLTDHLSARTSLIIFVLLETSTHYILYHVWPIYEWLLSSVALVTLFVYKLDYSNVLFGTTELATFSLVTIPVRILHYRLVPNFWMDKLESCPNNIKNIPSFIFISFSLLSSYGNPHTHALIHSVMIGYLKNNS